MTLRRWTGALIAAGADIVFPMLNGARQGASDARRDAGARHIGNALDWLLIEPAVFIASALARIDRAVEQAGADMQAGRRRPDVRRLGLADDDIVGLTLAPDVAPDLAPEVAADVLAEIDRLRAPLTDGRITVPTTCDGPEFAVEA